MLCKYGKKKKFPVVPVGKVKKGITEEVPTEIRFEETEETLQVYKSLRSERHGEENV